MGAEHLNICSIELSDFVKVQRTVICHNCGALHLWNVFNLIFYKY